MKLGLFSKRLYIRLISISILISFLGTNLSYAAPRPVAKAAPIIFQSDLSTLISRPESLDIPYEFASLKEVHKGDSEQLIIHIQDPHANYSGQKNLARTLDYLLKRYDIPTVMVEGSSKDASLNYVHGQMPQKELERASKQLLYYGIISGEEHLNLVSKHNMQLLGIEDQALYEQNLKVYQKVLDVRTGALDYIRTLKQALSQIKNQLYPKSLLDYESGQYTPDSQLPLKASATRTNLDPSLLENTALHSNSSSLRGARSKRRGNLSSFNKLISLAQQAKIDLSEYASISIYQGINEREELISFTRVNQDLTQLLAALNHTDMAQDLKEYQSPIAQYQWLQNIYNLAKQSDVSTSGYVELKQYKNYLLNFKELNFTDLLSQMDALEQSLYAKYLITDDTKKLRAIDRYLQILDKGYHIQMTTQDTELFNANKEDFETRSIIAFLNLKLAELNKYEHIIEHDEVLDESHEDLTEFYEVVYQRDFAFINNAKSILEDQNTNISFMISGGYHTDHINDLLKQENISYITLTPKVTSETNHQSYEGLLFASTRPPKNTLRQPPARVAVNQRAAHIMSGGSRLGSSVKKLIGLILNPPSPIRVIIDGQYEEHTIPSQAMGGKGRFFYAGKVPILSDMAERFGSKKVSTTIIRPLVYVDQDDERRKFYAYDHHYANPLNKESKELNVYEASKNAGFGNVAEVQTLDHDEHGKLYLTRIAESYTDEEMLALPTRAEDVLLAMIFNGDWDHSLENGENVHARLIDGSMHYMMYDNHVAAFEDGISTLLNAKTRQKIYAHYFLDTNYEIKQMQELDYNYIAKRIGIIASSDIPSLNLDPKQKKLLSAEVWNMLEHYESSGTDFSIPEPQSLEFTAPPKQNTLAVTGGSRMNSFIVDGYEEYPIPKSAIDEERDVFYPRRVEQLKHLKLDVSEIQLFHIQPYIYVDPKNRQKVYFAYKRQPGDDEDTDKESVELNVYRTAQSVGFDNIVEVVQINGSAGPLTLTRITESYTEDEIEAVHTRIEDVLLSMIFFGDWDHTIIDSKNIHPRKIDRMMNYLLYDFDKAEFEWGLNAFLSPETRESIYWNFSFAGAGKSSRFISLDREYIKQRLGEPQPNGVKPLKLNDEQRAYLSAEVWNMFKYFAKGEPVDGLLQPKSSRMTPLEAQTEFEAVFQYRVGDFMKVLSERAGSEYQLTDIKDFVPQKMPTIDDRYVYRYNILFKDNHDEEIYVKTESQKKNTRDREYSNTHFANQHNLAPLIVKYNDLDMLVTFLAEGDQLTPFHFLREREKTLIVIAQILGRLHGLNLIHGDLAYLLGNQAIIDRHVFINENYAGGMFIDFGKSKMFESEDDVEGEIGKIIEMESAIAGINAYLNQNLMPSMTTTEVEAFDEVYMENAQPKAPRMAFIEGWDAVSAARRVSALLLFASIFYNGHLMKLADKEKVGAPKHSYVLERYRVLLALAGNKFGGRSFEVATAISLLAEMNHLFRFGLALPTMSIYAELKKRLEVLGLEANPITLALLLLAKSQTTDFDYDRTIDTYLYHLDGGQTSAIKALLLTVASSSFSGEKADTAAALRLLREVEESLYEHEMVPYLFLMLISQFHEPHNGMTLAGHFATLHNQYDWTQSIEDKGFIDIVVELILKAALMSNALLPDRYFPLDAADWDKHREIILEWDAYFFDSISGYVENNMLSRAILERTDAADAAANSVQRFVNSYSSLDSDSTVIYVSAKGVQDLGDVEGLTAANILMEDMYKLIMEIISSRATKDDVGEFKERLRALVDPMLDKVDGIKALSAIDKLASSLTYAEKVGVKPVPRMADQSLAEIVMNILRGLGGLFNTMRGSESVGDIEGKINRAGIQRLLSNDLIDFGEVRDYLVEVRSFQMHFNTVQKQMNETINFKTILHNTENVLVKMKALKEELEKIGAQALEVERARSVAIPPEKGPVNEPLFQYPEIYFIPMVNAAIKATELFQQKLNDQIDLDGDRDSDTGSRHKPTRMTIKSPRGEIEEVSKLDSDRVFDQDIHLLKAVEYFNEEIIGNGELDDIANIQWKQIIDLFELIRGDGSLNGYDDAERALRLESIKYGRPQIAWRGAQEIFGPDVDVPLETARFYEKITSGHPDQIFVDLPGFTRVKPLSEEIVSHPASGQHRLAWFLTNYLLMRNGYAPFYINDISEYAAIPASRRMERTKLVVDIIRKQSSLTTNVESSAVDEEFSRMSDMDASYRDALGVVKKLFGDVSRHEFVDASQFKELWEQYLLGRSLIDIVQNEGRDFEQLETDQMDDDNIPGFVHVVNAEKIKLEVLYGQMDSMSTSDDLMNDRDFFIGAEGLLPVIMRLLNSLADKLKSLPFVYMYHLNPEEAIQLYVGDEPAQVRIGEYKFEIQLTSDASQEISVSLVNSKNLGFLRNEPYLLGPGQAIEIDSNISGVNLHIIDVDHQVLDSIHTEIRSPQSRRSQTRILNMNEEGSLIVEVQNTNGRDEDTLTIDEVHAAKVLFKGDLTIDGDYQFKAQRIEAEFQRVNEAKPLIIVGSSDGAESQQFTLVERWGKKEQDFVILLKTNADDSTEYVLADWNEYRYNHKVKLLPGIGIDSETNRAYTRDSVGEHKNFNAQTLSISARLELWADATRMTNMETVVIDVADESGRAEWDEKLVVLDSEFGLNPRAEYGELELGLARRFEEFISGRDFFDDIDLPDSSSFFKFVGEPFDRKIILKMIDAMKSDNSPNFEEIFTELERKGGSEYVNTHGIEMENKPHSMFNVSGYWDDVDLSVEAKLIHSLNHLVTGDSSAYAEYRQFISQLQGLSLDKRVKIEVELKRIGGVKQRLVAWFLMHQYPYATHLNLYHRSRNLDHFTGSQHEFKDPTFFGIEPEYPAIYLEETLDGEVSGQVIKAIIPIDSLISFNFGRREAEELVVQEGIYEISIQTTIGGGRMASLQEELAEKFDDSDVAVWYASYAGTKETVEYANAAFATVFGSSVEAILDNPTYVEINETGADIREYKIQDAEAMRVGVFIDRSDGSGISVVKIKFGDGVLGIFVPTILTTDKSSYGGLEPELVKALELVAPEFLESGLIDALMRPIVEYSPTDEDLTSGRVAEILAERLEESLERGEQLILNTPYLDYEILEQYGDNTFRAQRISPDAIGINENTILKVLDEPDTWEQKFTTFKQLKEARQLAFERHDQTALRMLPEFIHLNREFGLAETVFIDGTRLDKLEGLVETHEEDYGIEIDEERLKFQYVFQFAADLAYMHQTYKLFHNDISESNIMIGKNHELRLIDFDEARIYTDSKERLVKMRNVGKYWDIVQVATLIAQLYSRSYEPEFETRLKQPGQEIDIAEYIASREHVDKRFDEGKVPPTFLEALLKATLQHPTEHYESLGQFVTDLQKALLKKYPRGSLGSAGRMAPLRDRDTSDDALGLRRIRAEQRKTRNLFNVNALMGGSRVMREFNILNHESDLEEYAYSGTWDEIVEQYQQDKPKFVDNKKIYISSELKAEDRVHSVVAILDSVSMADEVTALSVLRGIYNTSSPADFQMHIIQDQGIRNIHFKMIQFGQSTDTKPLLGKSLMRSVFLNMHDIIKTAFGREAGRWTMSGVVHNPKVQAFFEEFPRTNDASSDVTQVIQRYEPEFREDGPVAWLGYIGESPGGSQAPTPTAPRMTPIDMAWLDDGGMREKIAEIRKTSKEIFGGDWSKAGAYLKGGRAPVGGFAAKELLLFYIIASEDLLNTGFNSRDFQVNGVPVIDLMGRNIEVILTQLVPQARRIPNKETSQFRTFQLRSNGLEFATDALKRYEQSLGESVFAGDPVLSIAEAIKDLFGLTQSTNIRFLKPMLNDGERLDVLAYVIAFYRRHKTTPTITAITQYFETSMRKPLNAVSNLSRDLGLAFPSIGNGWQAGHGNAPILTVPKAEVIAIRRFISAKAIAGAEPKPLSTLSADHKRLIGAYYGSKINTRPYEIIVYILSYYTDHQEMPSLTEVAKHLMLPDSRDVKTSLAAINGVLTQLNVAPLKLVRKANSYQQDVRLQTISATRQKFEPKARMAIMNYAEMLPKLYSNDVVKARQLAGLFAGAQWEGGSNLQRLMSRSGLKLLEKTEFGTKRFFDQNGRWIMTVDPFGNKIDALVWGDDGQFIKAWTRNENGQGVVLSKNPANGLATVVRLEKFDGDIFSFSPGIDFNNLSKIPYAVFNPDMNLSARTVDQSRGVAISVLRLMSHIAKDQGNTLVYEFDDEINYPIPSDRLYGSLLEVADVPTRFIRVAQTAGLRDYGVDETPDYVLTPERRSFRKFPQAFFWNPNPPERAFNPTTKTFVSYRDGQVERVYYGDDTYVHFEFEMGKLRERNYYVEKEGNNTFRLSGNLDALIDWYGNFIKDAGGVSDENNYVSRMSTQLLESPLPSKRAEKLTGLDETHIALASPYVDRMSYIASSSDATGLVAFKGNRIFNPDGSERVVNASRARLEELRQKNMRPRAVESNLSAIQFKRKLTQSIANYSLGSTLLDKLIQVVNGPFEIINDVESFVNALPSNLSMLYALQKDEHFSGGLINQIFVGGKKESEALDAYKKQLLAGDAEVGFGTFVDGIQIISMDEALGSLKGQKAVFAGTAKAFGQYYSQEKFGDLVDQGHIAITPTHAARPGQAIDSLNQLISGALLSAWQRLEPEDRVAYADDMGHYFRNTYNIRKSHEIDDLAESSHGQLEWYEDVSLPVLGEFDWTTFMQLQPKLRRATQASA